MNQAPPTPKGFRDIGPDLAKKRRQTIRKIEEVLEEFGFVPIETPTIEFADTLTGKYGEEEKLIYKFKDRGDRDLALRYDLTVPLARYVAANNPKLPFSRYQTGQVFRGENPQHGRYREFTQFDFDTVGSNDPEEDAKVIACAIQSVKAAGVQKPTMFINDRENFREIPIEVIRAFDKITKIGPGRVKKELKSNFKDEEVEGYFNKFKNLKPTDNLLKIFQILENTYNLKNLTDITPEVNENGGFIFHQTLARGLDYYTGAIFEMMPNNFPNSLSIGAGGRYDNLIGMFAKSPIPAVGFSFGIDRLVESLEI